MRPSATLPDGDGNVPGTDGYRYGYSLERYGINPPHRENRYCRSHARLCTITTIARRTAESVAKRRPYPTGIDVLGDPTQSFAKADIDAFNASSA
jgi:hypothetical protein